MSIPLPRDTEAGTLLALVDTGWRSRVIMPAMESTSHHYIISSHHITLDSTGSQWFSLQLPEKVELRCCDAEREPTLTIFSLSWNNLLDLSNELNTKQKLRVNLFM
jgi:hypothetical protein